MNKTLIRSPSVLMTWTLGILSVICVIAIVRFPSQSFEASLGGLGLWWNIVFPGLLPYYILCEIVAAYGLSRYPLLYGLLVGYPAGATLAAELHKRQAIGQSSARKIASGSFIANPVFMITIIGYAYLGSPEIGFFVAVVQVLSLLLCTLVAGVSLQRALPNQETRTTPTFGYVLGTAVSSALERLMKLGGTMMIFAVAIRLIEQLGLVHLLVGIATRDSVVPILTAVLDPYLGTYALAKSNMMPFEWTIALISAAIAWGGLSTHLQVRSAFHGSDLRYSPFLIARIVQAAIAGVLAFLLWDSFDATFVAAPNNTCCGLDNDVIATVLPAPEPNIAMSLAIAALAGLAIIFRLRLIKRRRNLMR